MAKSRKARILVIDDALEMAATLADGLCDRGYEAVAEASGSVAVQRLKTEPWDAVVTDLRMPEVDGMAILATSKSLAADRPVLVMTAYGAVDSAVESIRQGAYHYLTKPFKIEELALFVGRALEESALRLETQSLQRTLQDQFGLSHVLGSSAAMQRVRDVAQRVAPTDATVLLLGETGTGKGLLAQAIHSLSPRSKRRLVKLNCAAVPEALLESELFGHLRGSFTGATADHPGLFVEADGGTLFLDEIGEMSPLLQAKLLHVLETGSVRPVGSTTERSVDVRIISATHRDLSARVLTGAFREDLRYRLDVLSIELPPLRERNDDIPELLEHFLGVARARHPSSPVQRISPAAVTALLKYRWPGNVRELAHLVERLTLLSNAAEVPLGLLPASIVNPSSESRLSFSGDVIPVRLLHHQYATWALQQTSGHRARAAEKLGVDVKTLRSWLEFDPERQSNEQSED